MWPQYSGAGGSAPRSRASNSATRSGPLTTATSSRLTALPQHRVADQRQAHGAISLAYLRQCSQALPLCRAVDVQKTITIDAPVEEVFRCFRNVANFPRFMAHLREVRDLGNGRSHWVAEGPAGVPVAWDAVITRSEPNRVLAWQSEPGATVANAGNIRFEPIADNRTRVTIRLSYNPPAGALGHVVAKLFGADPKSELDDDLVRLKSLIEYGKASVGRTTVTREDVDLGQAAERTPDLQARERGAEPPAPEY